MVSETIRSAISSAVDACASSSIGRGPGGAELEGLASVVWFRYSLK